MQKHSQELNDNSIYNNIKTRKLMTMHKALYPVDRLYVSRKEGGRRLASIETAKRIDTMTRRLHKRSTEED